MFIKKLEGVVNTAEKNHIKKNYVFLKEYKEYYLYGYEKDGKVLYRECFLKTDVDGVPINEVQAENRSRYLHI